MQIYLIRHGITAGNLERRYVGVTDEELTAGAVQELRAARMRYPVPDCVFTSPLKRCVQTAQILFPELQPESADDLRECAFGAFEYRNYQELQGDERYQEWIDSGGTLAFPGGESREGFSDRCCAAFEKCCRRAAAGNLDSAAFVVHGGTIMAILDRYSSPHRDYFDWQVENAGGYQGSLDLSDMQITDLKRIPRDTGPVGIEDQYIMKQQKKLRFGYTTGSCAAAAAKAAAELLLTGTFCDPVELMTPKGILLRLPVQRWFLSDTYAECAVRKYGGDDPDATDGLLIRARAEYINPLPEGDNFREEPERRPDAGESRPAETSGNAFPRIMVEGGSGVGRVTKPGLEQPVGAAAINRVPREMIAREAAQICEAHGYRGSLRITISVPGGAELARKTFNPHLGIEGGISILGTSGIVVPMSEEALLASIRLEMQQKFANGERYLLITPGNYGEDFIRRGELLRKLDAEHSMKCSNYVGETVDMAAELGFAGILFVAHIGKFIKVSGGIMNTHSAQADCRAELIAAQALRAVRGAEGRQGGGPGQPETEAVILRLLDTNTTEEAVSVLQDAGILDITMEETVQRIRFHLQKHCQGRIQTEVVLFSNKLGYLGESDGAEAMMEKLAEWEPGTVPRTK